MDRDENRSYESKFRETMTKKEQEEFDSILQQYGTCDILLADAKEQLSQVAERAAVPQPLTGLLHHWSDSPYFVGWHSWNIGYESWKTAEDMVQPFKQAELFTCGEAFSSEQGWIEGALKSTERVLEKLGVNLPDWVDKEDYKNQQKLWL